MAPPPIKVRGAARSKGIPQGYILGRSSKGNGDVELLSASDFRRVGIATTTQLASISGADPTATIASTFVNGVASTFMRSDAAPKMGNLTGDIVSVGLATTISANVNLPGSPTTTTQPGSDSSTKIATTAQVQAAVAAAIAGVNPATSVNAATTLAANTSSFAYSNGVAGIGATLTGTVNTPVVIDGFTFSALGQRLLVKNDTASPSGARNGVYSVTQLQTAILPPVLTRALDYDMPSDINNTGTIPVISGTINALTSWLLTSTVNAVGTDPLTYVQFSFTPISAANPTATASNVAVNGTATTFMRSDASPAIQLASSALFGLVKADGSTTAISGGVISSIAYLPLVNGDAAPLLLFGNGQTIGVPVSPAKVDTRILAYFATDTLANRPATPNVCVGSAPCYLANDTGKFYVWSGSTWMSTN